MFRKSTKREDRLVSRALELAITVSRRLGVNLPNVSQKNLWEELKQFVETGNFETDVNMVCVNPTFVNTSFPSPSVDTLWTITNFLSCPLDAYLPVPFNDQPHPNMDFGGSAYRYCKLKLQSFAIDLKQKKSRIKFFFYYNNSMDQCLGDKTFKNRFQVIHCPDLVDEFGLANVLLSASGCLASTPEAVLLTETRLNPRTKPSLAKYVEENLCCPITLIPTVYGVKLASHVELGSIECYELHGSESKHIQFVSMLRWLRIPTYSRNIRLGFSSDVRSVIVKLLDSCHLKFGFKKISDDDEDRSIEQRQLTPLTFFFILQSMLGRSEWIDGAPESLLNISILPSFTLAWETIQNWIAGKTVCVLSTPDCLPPGGFDWKNEVCLCNTPHFSVQWWLISKDQMIQHKAKVGQPFPAACQTVAQRIDCLLSTKDKSSYRPVHKVAPNFFLLLAMNHDLHKKNTRVCITDAENGELIYYTDFFKWFKRSYTIVNPNPSGIQPSSSQEANNIAGMLISSCLEFKTRYEVEILIRGVRNGYDGM